MKLNYLQRHFLVAALFAMSSAPLTVMAAGVDVNLIFPGAYPAPQPAFVQSQPVLIQSQPVIVRNQPEYVQEDDRYWKCKKDKCKLKKEKKEKRQKHHKHDDEG